MHGLLFVRTHKHALTLLTVRLSLKEGGNALILEVGLVGDYPKHRNERITKRWCNPAVNHTSLANIGFSTS